MTRPLVAKGVSFGAITARPDGSFDESGIEGVDADLRIRPFFAHGGTISIREFVVGALRAEMGLEIADPDTAAASTGARITTPAGMLLDGRADRIEAPPVANPYRDVDGNVSGSELPTAIVDYLEFYLLNYFKPATYKQTDATRRGLQTFRQIGCASCHVPEFTIEKDRRVADVETVYDPERGILNGLFATATPLFESIPDATGFPTVKRAIRQPFVVRNIFTDFKRHDLGPAFHERNWDGTTQKEFLTRPLWGVGSKIAFGHDGRSINLFEAILRHGGEAQKERDAFAARNDQEQQELDRLPAHARALPAGRHGVEPGSRRPDAAELSAGGPRQHPPDEPLQRSEPTRSEPAQGDSRIASLPAATSRRSVTRPEGQRIVTRSAVAASPRPK